MLRLSVLCATATVATAAAWSAPEPFQPLSGANPTARPAQPNSDDPLVRYAWSAATNTSALQIYRVPTPGATTAAPPAAFGNVASLTSGGKVDVTVSAAGSLRLDFGVERAAWFEFESKDLGAQAGSVSACVSEYDNPWPGKTQKVKAYGSTYRLETNTELYEGVRYAWIIFEPSTDAAVSPWHITNVSVVAQVKPIAYTGSFSGKDDVITKVWYSGAYGVRLNMEANAFNSILMDRGDRVSIQGDGHPTMAAGLVAFSPYELVHTMLNATDSGSVNGHKVVDQGIMPYPIYWTMSVNDWYWASGSTKQFLALVPDMRSIVDARVKDFLGKPNMVWMGWDDRVGNGWCGSDCGPDGQLAFAALVIRAAADLSKSLKHAGQGALAAHYTATAARLKAQMRQLAPRGGGAWHSNFGLHAAANAINANVASKAEVAEIFAREMNDSTVACSFSPFNQFWNLQAYGNAGNMDYAMASVRLCWGTNLKLGKGCFWELYSPEWSTFMQPGGKAPTRPSYCHPWASGVTAWLTHAAAGLRPSRPGYAAYLASPFLGAGVDSAINATVATPAGPISVRASRAGGVATIEVTASVAGKVGLRKAYRDGCLLSDRDVLVDGAPVVLAGSLAADELGTMHELEHERHAWAMVSAGRHSVRARYTCASARAAVEARAVVDTAVGIPHFPPFLVPAYVGAGSAMDTTTGGNWVGNYGTKGYVLFGFDQNASNPMTGIDRIKLPASVINVSLSQHGFAGSKPLKRTFLGSSNSSYSNASFLQDPDDKSGPRKLGNVGQNPSDGSQGFLININASAGVPLKVSLYCVGEDKGSEQAVRVMDLRTFNPIAPEPYFAAFNGGAWWTLTYTPPRRQSTGAFSGEYNSGVTLRVMGIYGMTASAVLFD